MLSPVILEPVFAESRLVGVSSLAAGSDIFILYGDAKDNQGQYDTSQALMQTVAGSGTVWVKLNAPLDVTKEVVALVRYQKEESVSQPAQVQPIPQPFPPPLLHSMLYVDSTCFETWGMVPGSKVTAYNVAAAPREKLGEGDYVGGWLELYTRPLQDTDRVQVEAELGGLTSKSATLTPEHYNPPADLARQLPAVRVQHPLTHCDRTIALDGVVPGAVVVVYAEPPGGGQPEIVWNRALTCVSIAVVLSRTLAENEQVYAAQTLGIFKSVEGKKESVGSLDWVPPPRIVAPVRQGDLEVSLNGVLPDGEVEFYYDGKPKGKITYGGQPRVGVPCKLEAGHFLGARQGMCPQNTKWSEVYTVEVEGEVPVTDIPRPTLEPDHYASATTVRLVKNQDLLSNATIKVFSNGALWGIGKGLHIPVPTGLIKDQFLTATQAVSGHEGPPSAPVKVKPLLDKLLKPQILAHAFSPSLQLSLSGLIPGARVECLADKLWLGAPEAMAEQGIITLDQDVWPGWQVTVRQRLGSSQSDDIVVKVYGGMAVAEFTMIKEPQNYKNFNKFYYMKPLHQGLVQATYQVKVLTSPPVKKPTLITLTSSDPQVLALSGVQPGQLKPGDSEAAFEMTTQKMGLITLTLQAPNYVQAEGANWFHGQPYDHPFAVHGFITVQPDRGSMHYLDTLHLAITMDPPPADLNAIVQGFNLVPPPYIQPVSLKSSNQAYDVKLIGSQQSPQPGSGTTLEVYRHPPLGSEYNFPNKQVPANWPNDLLANGWPKYIPGRCEVLILKAPFNYKPSTSLLSDEERRLLLLPKDQEVFKNQEETKLGKVTNIHWLYRQKSQEPKKAGQIIRFENPNGKDMYVLTKENESPIPIAFYIESAQSVSDSRKTDDILNTYSLQLRDSAINVSLPSDAGLVIVYQK